MKPMIWPLVEAHAPGHAPRAVANGIGVVPPLELLLVERLPEGVEVVDGHALEGAHAHANNHAIPDFFSLTLTKGFNINWSVRLTCS